LAIAKYDSSRRAGWPALHPTNLKQHGVTFERAATVFTDRRALSEYDSEHSEIEDRWITMGLDHSGLLLVVVIRTVKKKGQRSSAHHLGKKGNEK